MATPEGFTIVPPDNAPPGFSIVEQPIQETVPSVLPGFTEEQLQTLSTQQQSAIAANQQAIVQRGQGQAPAPLTEQQQIDLAAGSEALLPFAQQNLLAPAPAEQLVNIPKSELFARNLPEIGGAPELNELNLDSIKAALGSQLITNEVELAGAIKSNLPESQISQDQEGNTLITFPSGTYAINKPGLSAQDFFQFLARAIAFTPAGRGAGLGIAGLARGGAQAGITETGLQVGEQALGGEFTPSQPVIATIAAPLGQLAGEKIVGPALGGVINKFKDIKATKLLEQAAPSIDLLKQSGRAIYDQIDESGARVSSTSLNRLINSINSTIKKEGFRKRLHPKTSAVLDEFISERNKSLTVTQIDELRKVAQSAASDIDKSDARLGNIIIDKIDNFLDKIGGKDLVGNKNVGSQFKEARKFWGRAKRAELVDEAFRLAKDQASGFENGLRTQFRSLLRRIDKGRVKGFSPEEIKAMRTVVQGTTAANITKQLGRFGISQDQATNSLMVGLGGAGGFAFGGGPGAVAVPLIGTVSRSLSEKLTKGSAKFADQIVKSGDDALKISRTYIRNVPKDDRNVAELTELLLRPNISLIGVKETGNKLIDDAVFFARNLSTTAATTNPQQNGG